jgi:hypothetical protein
MSEVKLTKSIPLSIIVGLLIQTGGMIWFMAHLDSRVSSNAEKLKERSDWMEKREDFETDITRQMIRLTMSVEQLTKTSDALNRSVKTLAEKVK